LDWVRAGRASWSMAGTWNWPCMVWEAIGGLPAWPTPPALNFLICRWGVCVITAFHLYQSGLSKGASPIEWM
jgi:hypothetical protein